MEIERKFLVRGGTAFKQQAHSCSHIRQGYIAARGATVRVRRSNDRAFLTIKEPARGGRGMSRYEFETEITPEEADHLFRLCVPPLVEKTRYLVRSGRHVFEVDEFHGANKGLIMAEVELESEDEQFVKPAFIGPEVTGDRRFYNRSLRSCPFTEWEEKRSFITIINSPIPCQEET